jgi:2-amino-4-hydroxy-6-hydroxymethyldihydropteridine diphosphokinase
MTQFRSTALVALGGNLDSEVGEPVQTLLSAIEFMSAEGLVVRAVSRFFVTPSFPDGIGPEYVNAAVSVACNLSPVEILVALHRIEHRFGRIRTQRWGMRTLDLDLLAVGQCIAPDRSTFQTWYDLSQSGQAQMAPDQLIVPHPRLQDRAFVLVPMADIAPEWVHPVLDQSVVEMRAQLPHGDVSAVRPI